ncbi:hypothetical protein [Umezawaea beigongshangensis]|uniref:hypothetical protein n=1 Tax=Umezawaea beigongshangensis TaxID=2780383 RepID=UPI0018F1408E|nr:hypothetical protein [Umezawaea beigongshangensis]
MRTRTTVAALLATATLLGTSAQPAAAYEPVNVVHTERVQAGPYGITVGFSTWPVRAMQSLDFTFAPDGGIEGRTGTVRQELVGADEHKTRKLARHPRKLEVWGMDIASLDTPGTWTMTFAVDGPDGRGEGVLPNLEVLEQPGPPLALSWAVATLPLLGLITFLTIAWRRTRPSREELSAV